MYRFIRILADGTLQDTTPGGLDLEEATGHFVRWFWDGKLGGTVAVYRDTALVARILAVRNVKTGRHQPVLQLWPEA